MKAKHYYLFEKRIQNKFQGNSLNKENWDILRMDETENVFAIKKSIESFEKNCMVEEKYKKVAKLIYDLLESSEVDFKKIISLGVGKGILEWHLKRLRPEIIVECTDYTKGAVKQLKQLFVNLDSAYPFDMLGGILEIG